MLLYVSVTVLAVTLIQPSVTTQKEPTHIKTAVLATESNKAIEAAEANTKGKPGSGENSSELQSQSINQSVAPAGTVKTQQPAPEPQASLAAAQEPSPAATCDEAIAAVWPAELQSGARLVSTKESSMINDRIGPLNNDGTVGYNLDGSRDYGCFQINDKAHPQFFANGDWRNPTYNAQYALKIYKERGNWTAWYAVRGILW